MSRIIDSLRGWVLLALIVAPLSHAYAQNNATAIGPVTGAGGGGGGGSGTVTSVSVTTANGVSGSVANPTTTPAISLTLGAITPTTVNGNTFGGGPWTITGSSGAVLDIGSGGTIGPFTIGSTTISSGTDKGLLFNNAGIAGNLATANSGVLVTSGAGVPSISSTLPTGIILVAPVLGTPASGVATNLTGTASGLTAGSVTTNANLTGPITSVGNATAIGSQTGTGNTFAMSASPTFTGTVGGAAAIWTGNDTAAAFIPTTSTIPVDGLYLSAVHSPTIAANSARLFVFNGTGMLGNGSSSAQIGATNTSATAPSLVPNRNDTTTGIGAQASGNMSFTVGAAEQARVVSTGLNVIATTDASAASGSGALQVPGGASVAKRFWLPAITASAGLQTAVLCQSSGGEVIADSVACLASSERAKEDIKPSDMGLNVIMALKPVTYRYRLTGNERFDSAPNQRAIHAGFSAEQAATVDSRLVAYDADGNVRTMRPDAVPAALVLAIQQMKADNDNLRVELYKLKRASAR